MSAEEDIVSASHDYPYRAAAYRVLLLQRDGAVVEIQVVIAGDDSEAIALAKAMVDGHAVELWDGVRFIDHFPPQE